MIKIIVKTSLYRIFSPTTLLLLSLFGLGACAPIVLPRVPVQVPQGYPVQQRPAVVSMPARRQRPQLVMQNVQAARRIPQAGALLAAPVPVKAAARAPAARAIKQARRVQQPRRAPVRPAQQQARKITVPPVLNPVQQTRVARAPRAPNTRQQSYSSRPSASVARVPASQSRKPIWEDVPRKTAPTRKQAVMVQRPSAAVRRPNGANRNNTAVAKPAARVIQRAPVKPMVQAQTATPVQPEVLDLSGSLTKNIPVQNKAVAVAATRSYNSSPAVAILIKQANNQLTVGKSDRAAATLERALRIESENPLLWLRLAEVNAQQGKKSQAASMARKALNLAPGDARLQARGQRLLN